MQIYFIRSDKLHSNVFHDLDVPPDFLLPVASEKPFEELFPNITKEHVIMGLLLALTTYQDHPSHSVWLAILEKMSLDVLDFFFVKTQEFIEALDLKSAQVTLQFLKGITPNYNQVKLLEARFHEEKSLEHARLEQWEEAQTEKKIALDLYSEMIKSEDPIPDAVKYLGLFFLKLQDEARALELLQQYLKSKPEDNFVVQLVNQLQEKQRLLQMFNLAYDKIMMNDEEASLQILEELIQLQRQSWEVWFMKGWAHRRLEQFESALGAFEQALEINPDHVDTLNEKALCLYELERLDEAEQAWTRSLDVDPMNAKILSNLAILNLRKGEDEEARYYLRAVLDIEPENQLMQKLLEELDIEDP